MKTKWYINNEEFNSWLEAVRYVDQKNITREGGVAKLHYEDIQEENQNGKPNQ